MSVKKTKPNVVPEKAAKAQKATPVKRAAVKRPPKAAEKVGATTPPKERVGRPTSFKEEYIAQARMLCQLGATDADLANFFGVALSTVSLWSVQVPEFSESKKLGKTEADDRVEQSLFKRAMGYEHDEVDIRVIGTEVVQTQIRKHYPPDTTAMIFWLKNRRKETWRDKIEHEMGGKGGGPITVVVKRYSDV